MQVSRITLVNNHHLAVRGDSTVGFFSNLDGPLDVTLCIFGGRKDEHIERAAVRFGVSVEALRAFRGTSVHGQSCAPPM